VARAIAYSQSYGFIQLQLLSSFSKAIAAVTIGALGNIK